MAAVAGCLFFPASSPYLFQRKDAEKPMFIGVREDAEKKERRRAAGL